MSKKQDLNIFITILIFVNLIQISLCLQNVEVFKLFAYQNGDQITGSKVSSFSLVSQHYSLDVFRKIALIHFNELSIENLVSLIIKRPFGILVILPQDAQPKNELQMMENLISAIKGKFSKIIVYFAFENQFINDIYDIKQQKKIQLSVKQPEPQLIQNLQLEDFYGYLQEIKTQNQLPTILLMASYDAFIPSAQLKLGFNSYQSGAYALLNIMKYLKDQTLYYNNLQYNVMFYLTSSKHNDFQQVNNWLNRAENQKQTGAIQYAFYLDILSLNNVIYFKQYPEFEFPEQIMDKIQKTSEIYNVTLLVQKQTVFQNQKIKFMSFSNDQDYVKKQFKPILDTNINKQILDQNVQFITESILKIIYDLNYQFKIIDDNQFINENENFQINLMNYFKDYSFYPTNIQKGSYQNKQLFVFFNHYTQNANKIMNYFNQLQFYSSATTQMTISEYQTPFFDIYLFIAIIAYLFILKKGFQQVFDQ